MGWPQRSPASQPRSELSQLPRIPKVRIRRKVGARGFYHAGEVVEEGQEIECDRDIAASLVQLGKAEYT